MKLRTKYNLLYLVLILYSLALIALLILMGNAKSFANSLIFPAPKPSYREDLPGLIWIPKKFAENYPNPDIESNTGSFPALYIPSPRPTNKVFIYLHGNGCDIGSMSPELRTIAYELNVSIIAVEYTGYGLRPELCQATGPSIDHRVVATFQFLLSLGVSPSSIIFYGRSIGTGPAASIAAYYVKNGIQCGGVILQGPYMSIHKISQKYFQFSPWLIDNIWNTEKSLEDMAPNTPLLIIHGVIDEVIPVIHGQTLYNNYKSKLKMADFQPDSLHDVYVISDVSYTWNIGAVYERSTLLSDHSHFISGSKSASIINIVAPIRRFLNEFNIAVGNEDFVLKIPEWCYCNAKGMARKLCPTETLDSSKNPVSEGNFGREIHRKITNTSFSSSLQDLCQRNSIKSDDISDIVNDARSRTITNNYTTGG